ncbi:serine/threonine-protein kinase MARK1-like [Lepus europaeus]|uniref:serine/threonine-protein kinase MARK1-like n=1 Tax=Lepus europaeus TaxID=9983 RepID=UPI002B47C4DB|nr:serine/threonine-protein kinase MARK1-like [Lepus europaeus]
MEDFEDFIAGASQHPELELLSFLGGGGFGVVLLARQVSSQRQVAVKLFQRDASDPLGARRAKEEASIMQLLRHQNVIELLEVCCVGRYHCLVMELAVGGDLYQHVMARGGLPEPEAMAMFYQVLAAVSHCHAQHVAHRDLKLENLLLDSRLNVKLGDFGLSCQLAQGALVRGFCGTAAYCAPEVFERWPYDAFAADIWSLGVILFAMLAGTMPFRGRGRAELQSCIRRGCYELPCVASPGLEELLNWLLSLDPRQRLSADMARYHWWFHPLLEEAQGEEVQPVRVSEDPEAQGLPPAPSRVSLQSDCRGLEQVQPCGQSARLAAASPHRLALVWDAPAPAAPREARSVSAWFTCENLSPQGRRESATTTAAAARPPARLASSWTAARGEEPWCRPSPRARPCGRPFQLLP